MVHDACPKCGFRRLLFNGLRKALCRTIPMNDDAIEMLLWFVASGRRYYTHQVAPTAGACAQEVARHATSARRANVANHTDEGDKDINHLAILFNELLS